MQSGALAFICPRRRKMPLPPMQFSGHNFGKKRAQNLRTCDNDGQRDNGKSSSGASR